MKTLQVVVLVLVVSLLLAIWSPWNNLNISLTQLFGIEPAPESSGLQVTSLAGELTVLIDNLEVGTVTPETSPLIVPGIEPGERLVQMSRNSSVSGAFTDFSKLIEFVSGTDVVIAYELGPSDDFSEGHIITVESNNDSSGTTFLNLDANETQSRVLVDGVSIGVTPITLYPISITEQHVVTVQADGYDTQEFRLLPSTQSERDKVSGLTINVDVQLFLQPLEVR